MPNKPRLYKIVLTSLTFFALLLIVSSANAKAGRTINIAGLVVDAKTMAPVSDASITDGDNHELGKTDKNGYYKVALQYAAAGELRFKLIVNKKGYTSITQNEHWGDLPDNYNSVMYFGLSDGREGSFSSLKDKVGDNIDYDNVAAGFAKVKEERLFNHKLWAAEQGNQNVLVKVDDKLYIVDSNGWIAIQSEKDAIIINDKQIVEAGQLNAILKRREVKSMTPVDKKNAKFAIYTR